MFTFWKKKSQPTETAKMSRADILAQAKANAASARAEIGDETLDKIKEAMMRKQNSDFEKAKQSIKTMDQDKVRDHLSLWLNDKP